mgnify:CR=1 FL=1
MVILDLKMIHHQLKSLVIPIVATLHKHIDGFRIHGIALGIIDTNNIAVGVVAHARISITQTCQYIRLIKFVREGVSEAVPKTFAGVVSLHITVDAKTLEQLIRWLLGNQINNATGSTEPLDCICAVNHFNPRNGRRIDGMAIPATVTKWIRLRHTIDHVQGLTAP